MLVEIRPIIGGHDGPLHFDVAVRCDVGCKCRLGHCAAEALRVSGNEESSPRIVTMLSLELDWILSEGVTKKREEAAGDPGILNLKLYDEQAVWLQ